jgi:acyl dehydratase
MNAWHMDTVAYWAGHDGYIWHSKTQFRSPAFEGDVAYVDGEVTEKIALSEYGVPLVRVQTRMTTQTGETILKGTAEVSLPV